MLLLVAALVPALALGTDHEDDAVFLVAFFALYVGLFFAMGVLVTARIRHLESRVPASMRNPVTPLGLLFRANTLSIAVVAAFVCSLVLLLTRDTPIPANDLKDFFATSAQVVAALIIALTIEQRRVASPLRDEATAWGLRYLVVGIVASLVGLVPWQKSAGVATAAFTLDVAALAGAVFVLLALVPRLTGAIGADKTSDTDRRAPLQTPEAESPAPTRKNEGRPESAPDA